MPFTEARLAVLHFSVVFLNKNLAPTLLFTILYYTNRAVGVLFTGFSPSCIFRDFTYLIFLRLTATR